MELFELSVAGGAVEAASVAASGTAVETCPLGTRAWYAWADLLPPGPRSLHVVGQVLAPTPCFEARLRPAAAPEIPEQLVLDVWLVPTRRRCPEVPTWIEARYDQAAYPGGATEVAIRCGGEVYAVVPIEEVH